MLCSQVHGIPCRLRLECLPHPFVQRQPLTAALGEQPLCLRNNAPLYMKCDTIQYIQDLHNETEELNSRQLGSSRNNIVCHDMNLTGVRELRLG